MQLPDFLFETVDGEILLRNHRIGLWHLLQKYNEGESAEMLSSRYPTLPLALTHKVIAFYLENQNAVDAYLRTCSAAGDQQETNAESIGLAALRQRLASNFPQSSSPQTQAG